MAAKVVGMIKLALNAGKANPAPPVGPALGSKGVNIMQFCKSYNAATQDKIGTVIPVEITVFDDRSFTFVLKTPPASVLLQKAAGVEKGSGTPNSVKVGKITMDQLKVRFHSPHQQHRLIRNSLHKASDLNTTSVDAAMKIVAGTARNMGITISG
ncbi:hypothetical protein WJX84_010860 [Apatococcus fuscideae]|uniref:50S ribosomal protein L11, chloroplastic n=1 Tax=Apatococcus fuscideae TaxID=2026836 RepID=A0AAW1SXA8_9CHLO